MTWAMTDRGEWLKKLCQREEAIKITEVSHPFTCLSSVSCERSLSTSSVSAVFWVLRMAVYSSRSARDAFSASRVLLRPFSCNGHTQIISQTSKKTVSPQILIQPKLETSICPVQLSLPPYAYCCLLPSSLPPVPSPPSSLKFIQKAERKEDRRNVKKEEKIR